MKMKHLLLLRQSIEGIYCKERIATMSDLSLPQTEAVSMDLFVSILYVICILLFFAFYSYRNVLFYRLPCLPKLIKSFCVVTPATYSWVLWGECISMFR